MRLAANLRHFWRSHLLIACGIAVTTAVVVGSLAVGDLVRAALRGLMAERTAAVQHLVLANGRFFHQRLADGMEQDLGVPVAPLLRLNGVLEAPERQGFLPRVAVNGVDARYAAMGTVPQAGFAPQPGEYWLNEQAARSLGVQPGDSLILRLPRPQWLPSDAPMSPEDAKKQLVLRGKLAGILPPAAAGNFDLAANQQRTASIFVPLAELQRQAEYPEQVNAFLVRRKDQALQAADAVNAVLAARWQPADVGFITVPAADGVVELRSQRIFIDDAVTSALGGGETAGVRCFTYLVDKIAKDGTEVFAPYSFVAAVDQDLFALHGGPAIPAGWNDGGVLINQWLADDQKLAVGDRLTMTFKKMDEGNKLVTATASFIVQGILPLTGAAADPSLMPPFPGIAGKQDCRDFDLGTEFNDDWIRDIDEAYWEDRKGTPKAFITLAAGQELWHNIYGNLTSVRVKAGTEDALMQRLRDAMPPATFGLVAHDLAAGQAQALAKSQDVGAILAGMSFFLIVAGLLVTGLLMAFALTRRRREVGLLLALGWPRSRVRSLLFREHALVAALGVAGGCLLAVGYAWLLMQVLQHAWSDLIGGIRLEFAIGIKPFAIGALLVLELAVLVFWLRLRGLRKPPLLDLLRGVQPLSGVTRASRRWAWATALVAALGALGLAVATAHRLPQANYEWFGVGSLLLIALLAAVHAWMGGRINQAGGGARSLRRLALANLTRAWGRSLTVLVLLAMASFLVLSVGAYFKYGDFDHRDRASGGGGFALWAETSIGLNGDLAKPDVQRTYRLDKADLGGVELVQFRTLAGDDASCQNLNRAQRPTLWGVDTAKLADRFTFLPLGITSWAELDRTESEDVVPAVCDLISLTSSLGGWIGLELPYRNEHGKEFRVKIVGVVMDSVFQGGLVIAESRFQEKYPSVSGYATFLADVQGDDTRVAAVRQDLQKRLQSHGLVAQPVGERIDGFNRIQNTYLAIFQVLGALGLLLGSFGLVLILLRNVEERRSEFAALRALGWTRSRLRALVLAEHLPLLLGALGLGLTCAVVGIVPNLFTPGRVAAAGIVVVLLVLVLVVGLAAVLLAADRAVRRPLLGDLRRE